MATKLWILGLALFAVCGCSGGGSDAGDGGMAEQLKAAHLKDDPSSGTRQGVKKPTDIQKPADAPKGAPAKKGAQ